MKRLILPFAFALLSCVASHHEVKPSPLGISRRTSELLAVIDAPGPLEVQTVNSSDWKVDRSGLINLANPKAKAAGLSDGMEPIQIYFHVIRHPTRGTFLIDSGVENAVRDAPDQSLFRGLIGKVMHREELAVKTPLGDWLKSEGKPVSGLLLTHAHLDHVAGIRELPGTTEIYAGPGETSSRSALNFFTNGIVDEALEGKPAVNSWQFSKDPDERFAGVLDVFGDGSLWALWVPGHTAGSTAYLARTAKGPVLFVGDTCHTVWGWQNDVEPGSFTADQHENLQSLKALRTLAAEHPAMEVRLGHQALPANSAETAAR